MKRIDLHTGNGPDQLTVMAVGPSRAGKTHFAGSWPRPIFLADASEHGWTTLEHMSPEAFYEPDRPPLAIGIETPQDMIAVLNALKDQAADKQVQLDAWPVEKVGCWEIGTVVVDSLTFYADAYFSALEMMAPTKDKRQMYGDLASHLRYLMIQFHQLPYHIVWTALSSINEDSNLRGALIAGSTAAKAPARCDMWLYLDKFEQKSGREVIVAHEAHTQNYAGNKAGHRFGQLLPPIIEPNFRVIEESLSMTPWTNRLTKAAPARRRAS